MKEGARRKSSESYLVIGIVIFLMIAVLVVGYVLSSRGGDQSLSSGEPNELQDSGKGQLSTINPGSDSGAGSQNISGGSESEGSSAESQADLSAGKLEIINKIDPPYTEHSCDIFQWDGALETVEDYDHIYGAMFNPSNIASKVISKAGSSELDVDSRPLGTTSTIYLELALVSQSGAAVEINSENQLILDFPLAGYTFGSETITIQQYDPNDTSAVYPSYGVRDVIQNQEGTIVLGNITGSHASGTPYAYFRVTFS